MELIIAAPRHSALRYPAKRQKKHDTQHNNNQHLVLLGSLSWRRFVFN
jgi:hypothetical protein